ncbi:hypothetical protein RFI_11403 [Reticulomyxa filosa]|uniref:TRAF-type domain-containing protein n=1 Tax=Reticulomyxa filosa TaxID=46433 RepID=X6NIB7_RETFI|nr:hypothetical protein RFI_11403 [Reticulomyxa filosa]|eukprot:ETO25736.1 hypothetical protein RFI_11403 [Reticulomyxa filosa]
MECSNGPCKMKLQFAYLKQHVEHECSYRTVMCKYEPLGCDWKGLAKDSKKHKKMCTTRELNASQLLRQVMAKNAQENNERERLKQIDNKYIEVTKIWESRCRNIVTRDVVLESGQSFDGEGVIHSRPFHALHHSWVVEIKQVKEKNENNKNNVETTRLKLRMGLENESKLRHRLLLHICVLRGPDTSQEFHPITFECEISRKDLYSQWVDFPIVGSMSSFAESLASEINLRVVLVDKRRGEVSHSFRADDDRGTSESSFEVDNYSDARKLYSNDNYLMQLIPTKFLFFKKKKK